MPTYPPTLDDIKDAIIDFPGLAKSNDRVLNSALAQATGEIEGVMPAAFEGTLTPRLSKSVWALCMDMVVWRMRWRVERDSETNDVPKALQTQRKELTDRLATLAVTAAQEEGAFMVDSPCLPDAPELPLDNGF